MEVPLYNKQLGTYDITQDCLKGLFLVIGFTLKNQK